MLNNRKDSLKEKELRLIQCGVKRLKEFGFGDVNERSIFINNMQATAFKQYLKTQLQMCKGQNSQSKDVIQRMITEIRIKNNESKQKKEDIKRWKKQK